MVVLYLIGAALAGSTLGAYTVLVWHSACKSFLFVELKNVFAELKKPVESILQGLWRLPWAVGFMLLQIFLWVIGFIWALASMFGLIMLADLAGLAGLVILLLIAFTGANPRAVWPAINMVTFAAAYGLSAYVGNDLVGKKKED